MIPAPCILYYLQFDQRLHNYIKHNNYENKKKRLLVKFSDYLSDCQLLKNDPFQRILMTEFPSFAGAHFT